MTNYIGKRQPKADSKVFYALSVDNDSNLVFTRIDLESADSTTFDIVNNNVRGDVETQHEFQGLETNYVFNNIEQDHTLTDPTVSRIQYKVRQDDLYYYINSDGNLVLRTGSTYTYS